MIITDLINFIMHIDKYLGDVISMYGPGVYLLLFVIIFLETGLVITPFLPGDSLIFAAGAFAARGILNVFLLFIIFAAAAIIGDSANYFIGDFFGKKVFSKTALVNPEYIKRTESFYERYGAKAIVLGRFIPIIRTFVPFVAGVGKMNYKKFLFNNIIGGVCWAGLFVFAGYFFGTIPFVKNNFTYVIIAIIVLSLVPVFYELWIHRKKKKLS